MLTASAPAEQYAMARANHTIHADSSNDAPALIGQLSLPREYDFPRAGRMEVEPAASTVLTSDETHEFRAGASESSEIPWADYELRYRIKASRRLAFGLGLFHSVYHDLRALRPVASSLRTDEFTGAHGAGVSAQWQATERWRLTVDYSVWQNLQLTAEGEGAWQQVRLGSHVELPYDLELSGALSYVDGARVRNVPLFLRVDLGLTWRPTKAVEVVLSGQHLLDDRRPETAGYHAERGNEVMRGLFGKLVWYF
ncbi:MAG: hypothetical protein AB1705_03440 [Verrucomicrobiota bacterium]